MDKMHSPTQKKGCACIDIEGVEEMRLKEVSLNIQELALLKKGLRRDMMAIAAFTTKTEARRYKGKNYALYGKGTKSDMPIKKVMGIYFVIGGKKK